MMIIALRWTRATFAVCTLHESVYPVPTVRHVPLTRRGPHVRARRRLPTTRGACRECVSALAAPRREGSHSRCARTPRMLISAPQGGAVYMNGGATATFTNTAFTSNTATVTDAPPAASAHAHRRAGARTPLASTRRARPLAIHHRVPLTRRTGSALALRAHARVIIIAGNDSDVASLFQPVSYCLTVEHGYCGGRYLRSYYFTIETRHKYRRYIACTAVWNIGRIWIRICDCFR